jgi:AraC-like DNA-binding protein
VDFQIHIPKNNELADCILFLWELKGGHEYTEQILPQGVIEIVFNLADQIEGQLPDKNELIATPTCFVQGIHTGSVIARYSGSHHLFGIRLLPHALRSLGVLSSELTNHIVDFTLFKPGFQTIWNQLGEAKTFQSRVKIIEKNFKHNNVLLCPRSVAISKLFASDNITSFQSVDELAQNVCYSTRQLNRKTNEFFGISAQELILYKKFMHAVKLMHHNDSKLGEISYLSGFYDQPHFNRVFKCFAEMTPKEYQMVKTALPFHLFK